MAFKIKTFLVFLFFFCSIVLVANTVLSQQGFSQSTRLANLEKFIEEQESQEEEKPAFLSSMDSSASSDPSDSFMDSSKDSLRMESENILSARTLKSESKITRTWIDWEQGTIFSWASFSDFSKAEQNELSWILKQFSGKPRVDTQLKEKALENLMIGLLNLPIDSYRLLSDSIEENSQLKKLLGQTLDERVYEYPLREKGMRIRKILRYSLYGKSSLSELMIQAEKNQPTEFFIRSSVPASITTSTPISIARLSSTNRQNSTFPRQSSPPFTAVIIDLRKGFFLHKEIYEEIHEETENNLPPNFIAQLSASLTEQIRYEPLQRRLYTRGKISFEEKEALLRLFPNTPYYQEKILSLYLRSQQSEGEIFYQPSLFPSIYDSKGEQLYSRFDNSSSNSLQYTSDPMLFYQVEKVGANPLFLFADKVQGENLSDIVISKEAVDKLFWREETWNTIRKEKRIFLLIR